MAYCSVRLGQADIFLREIVLVLGDFRGDVWLMELDPQ